MKRQPTGGVVSKSDGMDESRERPMFFRDLALQVVDFRLMSDVTNIDRQATREFGDGFLSRGRADGQQNFGPRFAQQFGSMPSNAFTVRNATYENRSARELQVVHDLLPSVA